MSSYTTILTSGSQAEQIAAIENATASRLCVLLGVDEVPEKLSYIVDEITLARYNRIGSEGLTSHTVEGETMNWNSADDFTPYMDEIEAYTEDEGTAKRRVVFL